MVGRNRTATTDGWHPESQKNFWLKGRVLDISKVEQFCEGLPRYKRPRKMFFDDVPHNPTGKIEKPKLRKKYTGHSEIFTIEPGNFG